MLSYEKGCINGVYITKKIMAATGLKDYLAVGFAGCWMEESHCNPAAYNKEEKSGTFKGSSANGSGYGAGLALWSNTWKSKILKKFNRHTPIETWTIDLQIEIVTLGASKSFLNLLAKCTSATLATDIVLRGYENGSSGEGTALRSKDSMKAYTWCKKSYVADSGYHTFSDGYVGALTSRASWANKILKMMGSSAYSDLGTLSQLVSSDGDISATGGVTGEDSNAYPVHDEYTTYTGTGGNIFSSAASNAYTTAAFADTSLVNNSQTQITRIYSTNDACIVLDELTLPMDYKDDSYANKGVTQSDVDAATAKLNASNSSTGTASTDSTKDTSTNTKTKSK